MSSTFNRLDSYSHTVTGLAVQALSPLLSNGCPEKFSHVVVATTCPDTLAPTLGQRLNQHFYPRFANSHILDLVQGCAGGISAMILGSQLSELSKSSVMVVLADAARQAVSETNPLRRFFGNGSFSCVIEHSHSSGKGLMHFKTRQYEHLSELVSVKLGHYAHETIRNEKEKVVRQPLDLLGLSMNPTMALRLLHHAEEFYKEFIAECETTPDVIVFHQVNPDILKVLQSLFSSKDCTVIDFSETIGNCGAASFGIAMDMIKEKLSSKKVFLCSFGTGGVISAGLWQF
jgi:3-oxoacyl-[acyl-carrier-protein] synthase III